MSLSSELQTRFREARRALSTAFTDWSNIGLIDMFLHNWHLGLTAFGGPTVHFQIFRELFVEKYQWIDEQTFQEMFALCQALSGPGSTKMLYAINVLRYGFWIGLIAFVLWSLPMAIAAFGVSLGVAHIGETLPGPTYALLSGLNSATVGIIALAAVQLSQKAITDSLTLVLVFLGGTAGMLYNSLWYFPVLMAAGGTATVVQDLRLIQILFGKFNASTSRQDVERQQEDESVDESASLPTRVASSGHDTISSPPPETRGNENDTLHSRRRRKSLLTSWRVGLAILLTFFITFIIIMVLRGTESGKSRGLDLFANLYLAGTIIFGGGPVVVPLLRAYVVAEGWVSSRDFLIGIAITQAFPGPNFNIAVYLGSLAVIGTDVPPAAGALIAYIAIFMPGLVLHTGMIGLWNTIRKKQAVRACLRGVHASAVGLVYTAVYRLFEIGYLDAQSQSGSTLSQDPWWVVIIATAFIGGKHFKLSPALAIVLGAIMGLIWYGVTR